MGRYYSGDIDGKFWFGVQSSGDADFFGVEGVQPNYLEYHFCADDDIWNVKQGVDKCEQKLGEKLKDIDLFFSSRDFYSDDDLRKADISQDNLVWYARLLLGKKILKCLVENGECSFVAEL